MTRRRKFEEFGTCHTFTFESPEELGSFCERHAEEQGIGPGTYFDMRFLGSPDPSASGFGYSYEYMKKRRYDRREPPIAITGFKEEAIKEGIPMGRLIFDVLTNQRENPNEPLYRKWQITRTEVIQSS